MFTGFVGQGILELVGMGGWDLVCFCVGLVGWLATTGWSLGFGIDLAGERLGRAWKRGFTMRA